MPRKKIAKTSKWKSFLLIFNGLMIGSILKAYFDTNVPKLNKVSFRTKKIPPRAKFSILQLSDVHNKVSGKHNEKLHKLLLETKADMIVITGDLISRGTTNFVHVYEFIEKITKINPNVFFVTGNHELGNEQVELFLEGLCKRGITILRNEHSQITIGNKTINLVGIDNESTNHEDLGKAFADVDKKRYTILLSHSPSVVESYHGIPADLILSGHTHGGQIRLPIVGAVVGPDRGFFPVLDKGIFEFRPGRFLYIDSGVGTSGYPVRFLNQSQISLVEISGEN